MNNVSVQILQVRAVSIVNVFIKKKKAKIYQEKEKQK